MESTSGQSRFKRPRLSSESSRASSNEEPILPPLAPSDEGKHTLVLDMDGTILMESNKKLPNSIPDFILEQRLTGIRTFVMQRCDLNSFLASAEQFFEIVIFTESSKKRADVILDMLENSCCIRHRLYRDSCTEINGRLVKDLSRLGRDLTKVILVDDNPFACSLQPFNAIPMPWFSGRYSNPDPDFEVLYPFLKKLTQAHDVRIALKTEYERQLSEGSKGGKNPDLHPEISQPNISGPLLPPMLPSDEGKYTLVIDTEGTLFADLKHKLPEEIGCAYFSTEEESYVYKRPAVEFFLAEMSKLFEIVLFTASTKERAETFMENYLENKSCIRFRLFRESCIEMYGRRIKDLSLLGRDLIKVIIIDHNPLAYELQQSNAIPIKEFDGEKTDSELRKLIPFLSKLREEEDVRPILQTKFDYDVFAEEELGVDHELETSEGSPATELQPRSSTESSRASLRFGESPIAADCNPIIAPSNEEPILPPLAPSDEGKHTLVLDMDGTILMESKKKLSNSIPDFVLEQKLTGIRTFVMQRSDLNSFLASAEQFFEIVIFTESSKKRADVILDMLKNSRCIRHRLYRDSCTEINGRLVKDLSRLGRDLRKVIIVDDCPFAYSLQRFNAIPMPRFNGRHGDPDQDFAVMSPFLMKLIKEKDVRIALETEFKRQLSESSKAHNNPNLHPTIIYPSHSESLLPPMHPLDERKYTLVLDMDGTLLHQSPEKLPQEIGSEYFTIGSKWYVYKRPGVELFMAEMAKLFEIVIFTASTKERAETVTNKLENKSCIRFSLFRDSCIEIYSKRIKDKDSSSEMYGRRVKDLSLLGRDLKKVIIIDDNPVAYELQQSNAIPIREFDGGKSDRELRKLIPFLRKLREEEDVRPILQRKFDYDVFAELTDRCCRR